MINNIGPALYTQKMTLYRSGLFPVGQLQEGSVGIPKGLELKELTRDSKHYYFHIMMA